MVSVNFKNNTAGRSLKDCIFTLEESVTGTKVLKAISTPNEVLFNSRSNIKDYNYNEIKSMEGYLMTHNLDGSTSMYARGIGFLIRLERDINS